MRIHASGMLVCNRCGSILSIKESNLEDNLFTTKPCGKCLKHFLDAIKKDFEKAYAKQINLDEKDKKIKELEQEIEELKKNKRKSKCPTKQ